jgi:hypothetical protein
MKLWQHYRHVDGDVLATREEVVDFLFNRYRGWCVAKAGFYYLVDQEW